MARRRHAAPPQKVVKIVRKPYLTSIQRQKVFGGVGVVALILFFTGIGSHASGITGATVAAPNTAGTSLLGVGVIGGILLLFVIIAFAIDRHNDKKKA